MTDWGIKVVNSGKGVTSTDVRDLILSSKYSMFKYHQDVLGTLTFNGGDSTKTGTIAHGLGYTPAFLAYVYYPNDDYQRLVPSIPAGVGVDYYPVCYADSTNIIYKWNFATPYNQITGTATDLWNTLFDDNSTFVAGNVAGNGRDGAFRFSNVALSKNQSITSAELSVYVEAIGTSSSNSKIKTYGIDEDNTGSFSSSPMGRSQTTAVTSQEVNRPTPPFTFGINVKSQVEEISSRSSWSSGNAMGFLVFNDSSPTDSYVKEDNFDTELKIVKSGSTSVVFRIIVFKDRIST